MTVKFPADTKLLVFFYLLNGHVSVELYCTQDNYKQIVRVI